MASQPAFGDAIDPEDMDLTQEYNFENKVQIGGESGAIEMVPGGDGEGDVGSKLKADNMEGEFFAAQNLAVTGITDDLPAADITQTGEGIALKVSGFSATKPALEVNGAAKASGFSISGSTPLTADDGTNTATLVPTQEVSLVLVTTGTNGTPDELIIDSTAPGANAPVGHLLIVVRMGGGDDLIYDGRPVDGGLMIIQTSPDRWDDIP
jgi:hypothetical protein